MDSQLDAFFAALSDPTRRAVIERLTQGPAPVSELHAPHDMALPSFLKHLRRLETVGLIRSEKTGRVRSVRLAPEPLHRAEVWLNQQRKLWEGRTDRLQALAEALERKPS
ncbi:ArsR/SmtB family transcription factor [Thalassococcus sp. BH17M4-6]|uniref:ArsR/SmtB family transcription factor n=1 Tax=Thalassococcus sp. BH17M4-6 TaxID=3413148 RepID=UPI003BDF43F6